MIAPFGRPVVPEVYMIAARLSGVRSGIGGAIARGSSSTEMTRRPRPWAMAARGASAMTSVGSESLRMCSASAEW
ncbi:MAG: hypothetical protein AUI15_24410 [Actinobacteria bacterium 13_2_20CM_2_66_6]|nr:MAG: hypothetical protein AUI15_24410 [Actinobacteria bacterium 13_2_20CM_2_66_6]